jgi:hypothetical protein
MGPFRQLFGKKSGKEKLPRVITEQLHESFGLQARS